MKKPIFLFWGIILAVAMVFALVPAMAQSVPLVPATQEQAAEQQEAAELQVDEAAEQLAQAPEEQEQQTPEEQEQQAPEEQEQQAPEEQEQQAPEEQEQQTPEEQQAVECQIDIKPGSFPNSINPNSNGVIPVAILTTADFDAATVDPATVAFGPDGAAPVHYALEDVDGDGDIDMILHFRTQDTGISPGDTEATLAAETEDGTIISCSDSVKQPGAEGQAPEEEQVPEEQAPEEQTPEEQEQQAAECQIDIKPGSFPNSINPNSNGVIPVAILTTADFDAATVDPATVAFGPDGAAPVHYALEDVDGDGDIDMILHFKTQDTGISPGDTEATLTAETEDGTISCSDSVRTVPPQGE